jgi:microcystin degradation protein MlrC
MGDPVRGKAMVKAVSSDGDVVFTGPYGTGTRRSFGPSACLNIAGFDVVVATRNVGIYDLEQFGKFGIDPAHKSVVVVKCMQGHHAAFDPIGSITLDIDTGGLTSSDLSHFSFTKVARPVWPIDDI